MFPVPSAGSGLRGFVACAPQPFSLRSPLNVFSVCVFKREKKEGVLIELKDEG